MRAVDVMRLAQTRAHALARHFQDAELADGVDGGLGAIAREILDHALFDVLAMLGKAHIDEIADDDSTEIAQTQLPRNLIDGFLIGLIGVGFAVARAARTTTVHIDGDQRFGLIDHQRTARRQRNFATVNEIDLSLDIKRVEDGHASVVVVHLRRSARGDDFEERLGAIERAFAVHHDAIDRCVNRIANGAQENVTLGVQPAWRAHSIAAFVHDFPQTLQILCVAREFGARGIKSRSAQDEPKSLGQIEGIEDLAHLAPTLFIIDFAAHANIVHVGHHHKQSPRNRQIAGDGRTLRAQSFLEDLHGDFLSATEGLLHHRAIAPRNLASDLFGFVRLAGEIFRMQIRDVQEAVGAFAEVDERRLNGGLNIDHPRLVDRTDIGGGGASLAVELRELAAFENGDANLVARSVVDDDQLLGLLAVMRFDGFVARRDGALDGDIEVAHRRACVGGRGVIGVGL